MKRGQFETGAEGWVLIKIVKFIAEKIIILVHTCFTTTNKNVKMHHICKYTAPRMLMQELCNNHTRISGELIHAADNNPDFLKKKKKTGDKTWCFSYNPQCLHYHKQQLILAGYSEGKVMLEVLFN
jgi:hypothetical protein